MGVRGGGVVGDGEGDGRWKKDRGGYEGGDLVGRSY